MLFRVNFSVNYGIHNTFLFFFQWSKKNSNFEYNFNYICSNGLGYKNRIWIIIEIDMCMIIKILIIEVDILIYISNLNSDLVMNCVGEPWLDRSVVDNEGFVTDEIKSEVQFFLRFAFFKPNAKSEIKCFYSRCKCSKWGTLKLSPSIYVSMGSWTIIIYVHGETSNN